MGPLPAWLQRLAAQLHADGFVSAVPDQAIINEYNAGQGIADHIDCTPCFGEVVISLSLGSPVVMEMKRAEQSVPVVLAPRSLLVMCDEARYEWTHGSARRKQDVIDGVTVPRGRRLSATFRKVIIGP